MATQVVKGIATYEKVKCIVIGVFGLILLIWGLSLYFKRKNMSKVVGVVKRVCEKTNSASSSSNTDYYTTDVVVNDDGSRTTTTNDNGVVTTTTSPPIDQEESDSSDDESDNEATLVVNSNTVHTTTTTDNGTITVTRIDDSEPIVSASDTISNTCKTHIVYTIKGKEYTKKAQSHMTLDQRVDLFYDPNTPSKTYFVEPEVSTLLSKIIMFGGACFLGYGTLRYMYCSYSPTFCAVSEAVDIIRD